MALPSTALPVFTDMYPPAWMMRSKALRLTIRSFMTGNAFALHGSTTIVSPSLKASHVKLAGSGGLPGTVRTTIDVHGTSATNSFPAVMIKCDRIFSFTDQSFIQYIKHFQERHFRRDIFYFISFKTSLLSAFF